MNPETISKQSETDQEKQQEQTPQQWKRERKIQMLICQKSCEGDTSDLGRGQEGVPSWVTSGKSLSFSGRSQGPSS